ncbi:MAG: hypothetical protein KDA78_05575 [Planctomycetaceae bacterium]|nr:hypothetical protein [Planctomycetaceae bacterium]
MRFNMTSGFRSHILTFGLIAIVFSFGLTGLAQADDILEVPAAADAATVAPSPGPSKNIPVKIVVGDADLPFEQLAGAEGYAVLIRDGQVVHTFSIGPGGVVQIPRPDAGVYAIAVRSLAGVATAGYVIYPDLTEVEGDLGAEFALVPLVDFPAAESIVARAMGQSEPEPPSDLITFDASTNIPIRSNSLFVDGNGSVRAQLISYTPEKGIARTAPLLSVHFLRDGKIASYAQADERGIIVAENLHPGRYSMIVTGYGKLMMMSILLEEKPLLLEAGSTAVSAIQQFVIGSVPATNLDADAVSGAGVVGPENSGAAAGQTGVGQGGPGAPGMGMAGGPGGGPGGGTGSGGTGGGGGGVGGSGGGGLLSALAAGAAGAAGAALAGGNDNNVASPE